MPATKPRAKKAAARYLREAPVQRQGHERATARSKWYEAVAITGVSGIAEARGAPASSQALYTSTESAPAPG
jgi:hypothetical protein